MANINYEDINVTTTDYKVGFFNLKNGEEAIVRFAINSVEDFELYTVHPITVGQASYPNRRVSCLRSNPKTDTVNMCPLCARGEKVQQRMYIKMIQYVNDNGRIIPKAVVWDRPAYSYAPQLKSYLDSYGPLSNIVCKIARQGEGLDTKYTIMPNLNPQMYNEQTYPKNFDDFADFNVLGSMVMDKTFDEVNQFIMTGSFPQREAAPNTTSTATPYSAETANPYANMQNTQPNFTPPAQDTPWDDNQFGNPQPPVNSQMGRPTRYY